MALDLNFLKKKYDEMLGSASNAASGFVSRVKSNPGLSVAQPWTTLLPEKQYNQYTSFLSSPTSRIETPKFKTSEYKKLSDIGNLGPDIVKVSANVVSGGFDSIATQLPKLGYDFGNMITGSGKAPTSAPFIAGQGFVDLGYRMGTEGIPNTLLDTVGKPQVGKWNIGGMNIPDIGLSESTLARVPSDTLRAFEPVFSAAGFKNPVGVVQYLGLGGAFNALLGDRSENILERTISGMNNVAPKATTIMGFNTFSNPVIDKIGGSTRTLPFKMGANIVEGVAIDKAANMETTLESVLIDAFFPLLSHGVNKASSKFKQSRTTKDIVASTKPTAPKAPDTKVADTTFSNKTKLLQERYRNNPTKQAEIKAQENEMRLDREKELKLEPMQREARLLDEKLYDLKQKQIEIAKGLNKTKGDPSLANERRVLGEQIGKLNAEEQILKARAKEITQQSRDVLFGTDTPKAETQDIQTDATVDTFKVEKDALIGRASEIEAKIGDLNAYRNEYERAGDTGNVKFGDEVKKFMEDIKDYAEKKGVSISELDQDGVNYLFRANKQIPDHEISKIAGDNIEDSLSSYNPTKARTRKIAREDLLGFVDSAKSYLDAIDNLTTRIEDQAALRGVPRVTIEIEDKITKLVREDAKGEVAPISPKDTGGTRNPKQISATDVKDSTAVQLMDLVAERGKSLGIEPKKTLNSQTGRTVVQDYKYLESIDTALRDVFARWDIKRHMYLRQMADDNFNFMDVAAVMKKMTEVQAEVEGRLNPSFIGKYLGILGSNRPDIEKIQIAQAFMNKTIRKMGMSKAWDDLYNGLAEYNYSPSLKKQIGIMVRDMASTQYELGKISEIAANIISKTRNFASINLITSFKGVLQNFSETTRLAGLDNDPRILAEAIAKSKDDSIYRQYGWAGNLSFDNAKGIVKQGISSLGAKNEMASFTKSKLDRLWKAGVEIIGLPFSASESTKTKVFLNFFDIQGRKKGLTGEALDNFVFDNMHTFAISGSELAKIPVNRGAGVVKELERSAFQFMSYSLRDTGLWIEQAIKSTSADRAVSGKARRYLVGSIPATIARGFVLAAITGKPMMSFMVNLPFWNQYQEDEPILDSKTVMEFTSRLPVTTPLLVQLAIAGTYVGLDMYEKSTGAVVDKEWETQRAYDMLKTSFIPLGNQVKQTTDAFKAIETGEVRTWDDAKLKYTVDNTPKNVILGTMFGKSALDETKQYNDNKAKYGEYPFGQLNMDEKETSAFEKIKATSGVGASDAFYESWLQSKKDSKTKTENREKLKSGQPTSQEGVTDKETLGEEIIYGGKESGFYDGGYLYKSALQDTPKSVDFRAERADANDSSLVRIKKENTRVSTAKNVFLDEEIPDADKERLYKELGVNKDEIEYDIIAGLSTSDTAVWLKEQLASATKEDAITYLKYLANTESLSGNKIFTLAVAKELGLEDLYKSLTADGSGSSSKAKTAAKSMGTSLVNAAKATAKGLQSPTKLVKPKDYSQYKAKKITPVSTSGTSMPKPKIKLRKVSK